VNHVINQFKNKIASLAFLRPGFEIQALFQHNWLFLKMKKGRKKQAFSEFLSVGKDLALAKHFLS